MTWSTPICFTKAHLAAPPADPTTVCPLSLAIWHTTDPTAPEAADTNTTSPGLGIAIFSKPTQAVSPGMPATPRNAWGGSPNVSSFCRLPAGALNRSRQPNQEETRSPALNRGSSEAATSPIAPPCSASPSWKLGRQPYMVELDAAIFPIAPPATSLPGRRSEEHTSELQSQFHLVCRLLLEKKKKKQKQHINTKKQHKERKIN